MADVLVRKNVPIPMRDGVQLYADIFMPADRAQHPVLLQRTAYDKDSQTATGMLNPVHAAGQGYAVVVQDCRGRYTSEGEFDPFACEIDDGYDTVEWCAAQEWCTGDVGMYGMSYVGATQWLAAIAAPPHLRAIFPVMTAADYFNGWVYQGGAFYLAFTAAWVAQFLAAPHVARLGLSPQERAGLERQLMVAVDRLRQNVSHVPLVDLPMLQPAAVAPYFYEWLRRPCRDNYWQRINVSAHHERVNVPAFNVGGWYDLFQAGAVRNFEGMRKHGATPSARDEQRLIMGPWTHNAPSIAVAGQRNFGWEATLALEDLQLAWFDRWLRGRENALVATPRVRYYLMNEGWREADDWPPEGVQETPFYLHSGGRANGLDGDGTLTRDVPADGSSPDVFLYNPLNPPGPAGPPGVYDQRPVEQRQDVLVYTTPPLAEAIDIAGSVKLVLYASTSAPDTDWYAKLVDVSPNGYAANVCDGILRARLRESDAKPELLEPGRPYRFEIDMLVTANRFQPGHRIRLEVASACFPKFDRNMNTVNWPALEAHPRPAQQTVFHDGAQPSHLVLPVLPPR